MPRKPLSTDELLRISVRCTDLFIARDGAEVSVAELARAAGLSERTFYRYFPTKAECLRPLFDAGLHSFARELAAQPVDAGLPAAVHAAFVANFPDTREVWARAVMATVLADPAMRRVWFEASWQTARLIRPTVARLLAHPEDSLVVTVGCGQAVLQVLAAIGHLVADGSHPSELADELGSLIFPRGTGLVPHD